MFRSNRPLQDPLGRDIGSRPYLLTAATRVKKQLHWTSQKVKWQTNSFLKKSPIIIYVCAKTNVAFYKVIFTWLWGNRWPGWQLCVTLRNRRKTDFEQRRKRNWYRILVKDYPWDIVLMSVFFFSLFGVSVSDLCFDDYTSFISGYKAASDTLSGAACMDEWLICITLKCFCCRNYNN